jgi:hypothetical protein
MGATAGEELTRRKPFTSRFLQGPFIFILNWNPAPVSSPWALRRGGDGGYGESQEREDDDNLVKHDPVGNCQ